MKKLVNIKSIVAIFTMILVLMSCDDDFLDLKPEDSFSDATFYQTDDQIRVSTSSLYSIPWYDFNTNTIWVVGELSSGNGRTWDPRNADFVNFAVNGNNAQIVRIWSSLYAVVAQSNSVINALNNASSPDLTTSVVNNAIGEARFIRSLAYFYLVRIFGSVPIIEDNTSVVLNNNLPRHLVTDIYRFIKEDLEYAMVNCNSVASQPGRITQGVAKAMLSKIYLYEENYAMAYQLADEVITSGEFGLFGGDASDGVAGSYFDLFKPENDNNPESIFALQWTASSQFAEGNGLQSLFAPAGFTGGGDGYSAIGISPDLLDAYENGDVRFRATFMERGDFYPDLNGGYTVPGTIDFQGTNHGIKKYVVGSAAVIGRNEGNETTTFNNTYILRYGELLLIHAEAALNGGGSAADGIASFNKIRRRAGLNEIAAPTLDDVFQERRIELAFEFEFWYDIVRRGPSFAIPYLSNSERGTFDPDTGELQSEIFTATADDLLFPYPTIETQNNPALLEAPVPYF